MHLGKISLAIAVGSAAAFGVAVDVPTDDVSVNLGLLLNVGHYYRYRNLGREHLDYSRFDVAEAELRVEGRAGFILLPKFRDSLRHETSQIEVSFYNLLVMKHPVEHFFTEQICFCAPHTFADNAVSACNIYLVLCTFVDTFLIQTWQ